MVDEYFYFTAEQPKLEGATVTVRDAFTQAVVAEAQTDVSGEVLFEDIPASVYAVSASAPQHESETFTVFLQPGELNETQVFLSQVTVTYTWTVEEIELEDKTEITIEAVFETDVPVPVVVADPPSVDLTELEVPGETMQVDITFTNHGLIAADHLEILLQSNAFYDIAPLITDLGLLPAKSSITVPFLITRILPDEPAPEAGARTITRVPTSSSLSISIRASCSSTIDLTSASPRPVPAYLRLRPESTCTKGSSTASRYSSGMPMPLSATTSSHPPASLTFAETTTRPFGSVNLSAFESRLMTI